MCDGLRNWGAFSFGFFSLLQNKEKKLASRRNRHFRRQNQ